MYFLERLTAVYEVIVHVGCAYLHNSAYGHFIEEHSSLYVKKSSVAAVIEDGVFATVRTNERHNGVGTIVVDIATFGSVVNEVVYGVGGNIVIIFAFYGHQNVGHFVRYYFLFDNVAGLFIDENAHDSVVVARFDIVEINLIVVAINAVGL